MNPFRNDGFQEASCERSNESTNKICSAKWRLALRAMALLKLFILDLSRAVALNPSLTHQPHAHHTDKPQTTHTAQRNHTHTTHQPTNPPPTPSIVLSCHNLTVSGLGYLRACCLPWKWQPFPGLPLQLSFLINDNNPWQMLSQ